VVFIEGGVDWVRRAWEDGLRAGNDTVPAGGHALRELVQVLAYADNKRKKTNIMCVVPCLLEVVRNWLGTPINEVVAALDKHPLRCTLDVACQHRALTRVFDLSC
jgi:hypothetical protein